MKKILFVITKSNWGGAQRYVYDLATHLPQGEFEVAVAFGQPGLLAKKLATAGIQTRPLQSLQRDVSVWNDIKSLFELYWLILDWGPQVVHLNSSKAGGVGALAAWLAGVPNRIFTVHGWPFLEARSGVARGLIWTASWCTALLSHKVICISDFDTDIARRMPFIGHKIVRIYNGIGPMELGPGDTIRNAFPAGAHIVGTIGELNKNKNQRQLIEEAKNDTTMYVAIVGEGEERAHLEASIKKYSLSERVKLFGFMPAAEVLRGFDTFALPSLKEGLPYVLLEAKQAGLPIQANRVGGVGEILDAPGLSEFDLDTMVHKTAALY